MAMVTSLESHRLPRLFVRGPDTTGPLEDVAAIRRFRDSLVSPSGVTEPTTLVVNLEGRFPTPAVLVELILPLAQAARAGTYGPVALVICTQDDAVRTVLRALAQAQSLPIFLARSPSELYDAEPAGSLTPTEKETLEVLRRLGGRTTVSTFAQATSLEPNAATNRLVNVVNKGFVQRVERPRRQGQLFVDPRAATPVEDPADPTSGDFRVPEPVRSDMRALAQMQVREPGANLASAWHEALTKHSDYLATEHERLAEMVKRDDKEGLAEASRRYAKKQAEARRGKGQT
jgi:DNA-binding MarR family transcriptional regulator